jgi:hypothetical protein
VSKNKDFQIVFQTVNKLEDDYYHVLEWTVYSIGSKKDEALFNVCSYNDKSQGRYFNIENSDFSAKLQFDSMVEIVSVTKLTVVNGMATSITSNAFMNIKVVDRETIIGELQR